MRSRISIFLILFVICLAETIPGMLHAATIHIPDDYPAIQIGLIFAVDGDTVLVAPGTYTGGFNKNLDFDGKTLVLLSEAGAEETIIDCEDNGRGIHFHNEEGPEAVMEGFSIINGLVDHGTGGGILCENASPTLRHLEISNCDARNGGGVACVSASPVLLNLVIHDNRAVVFPAEQRAKGGGLYCSEGSTVQVIDSEFRGNRCVGGYQSRGGGAFCTASTIALLRVDLFSNDGNFIGGGICIEDGSTADLNTMRIEFNEAIHGAGISSQQSTLSCDLVVLYENLAFSSGGGLRWMGDGSDLVVTSSTIVRNSAWAMVGGGLLLNGTGSVTLSRLLVAFNFGYGIHQFGDADVAIDCSDLFSNACGDYQGLPNATGINGNISLNPLLCDIYGDDLGLLPDSPCLPENNDCGVLMGVYGEGCDPVAAPVEEAPEHFSLAQNHPNPFNPETEIRFGLPKPAKVTLRVYDVSGRRVAKLLDDQLLPAGYHTVTWRGKNDAGRPLPSGVYFYHLEAGDYIETRKMTLLK